MGADASNLPPEEHSEVVFEPERLGYDCRRKDWRVQKLRKCIAPWK